MMKLKLETRSTNCNVLHFGDRSILFSYQTPVAVWTRESMHGKARGFYRTSEYYSRATTKHINSWAVTGNLWIEVSQQEIETIANGC